MRIAIVIPAYNEATHIATVLKGLPRRIGEHEVLHIVVDDGSKDGTFRAARSVEGVTVLRHRTNLGKGAAAKTGCDAAYYLGADVFVLMDGDGQHLPEDVGRMIAPVLADTSGNLLVIGARRIGGSMPMMMRLGNWVLNFLAKRLFGIRVRDTQSGFRAFSRQAYPGLRWGAANYAMETEMLILAASHQIRFAEVEIATIYLDNYKGTTALDGLRIVKTLLKWRLLWFREYRSLEPFSA